jgi:biotin carboxyl carrier protein
MANAAKRLRPHVVHEASVGESLGLPVRLVVSPSGGRLRLLPPSRFHEGEEWVSAGQVIAIVEKGPVMHEVRAPSDARVAGVLVRDGEPVAPGQPLVWLDETVRAPRFGPEGAR